MSVDRLRAWYGFTKLPFGRDLAPGSLFRSAAHGEAGARLSWCVAERGPATLTGEVGCGKTVAVRATVAGLEPWRHQVIQCANPIVGGRGILARVVSALGGVARVHGAALVPQAEPCPSLPPHSYQTSAWRCVPRAVTAEVQAQPRCQAGKAGVQFELRLADVEAARPAARLRCRLQLLA